MKKIVFALLTIVASKTYPQVWNTEDQYIQRFAKYAVEEMEKYKIPASITLAQGLLETGGGQSRLAKEGNNHFGIKCKEDWTGKTMKHTDDALNECFRVYDDPRLSYEDHSKFLAYRKFYAPLFKLNPKDYKAWAYGLKKAGYATNARYAQILISKIERYKLYEFDNASSQNISETLSKLYPDFTQTNSDEKQTPIANTEIKEKKEEPTIIPFKKMETTATQSPQVQVDVNRILRSIAVKEHPNDRLKYIVVPIDMELSLIAKQFELREQRLMKWNDLENHLLKKGDIIFLESKSSSGNVPYYKAQLGETMHDISQKFGIRLDKLYDKNRMEEGEQPKENQLIYLQDRKPRS